MVGAYLQDLESFEAISQDNVTRDLFLRMAAMSQAGLLAPFLVELQEDREVDDATKVSLQEIAQDPSF
ncbi:MAG: hypothetical protein WBB74_06300, partial [Gaiellaceae bacterium]